MLILKSLVVAIICMGMVVYPAIAKIKQMGRYYQYHGAWQNPNLVVVPVLFGKQQQHAGRKNAQGQQAMMVFTKAVPEGVAANGHGEPYHKVFEGVIINYFVS